MKWHHISHEEADGLMREAGRAGKWKRIGEAVLCHGPVLIAKEKGRTAVAMQSNAHASLWRWWPRGTFTVSQTNDDSGIIIRLADTEFDDDDD